MRFPNKSHRASFSVPLPSADFAEFCGIMLGDGGMSAYQAVVTLNSAEEGEYALFVADLMERLFAIRPSIYIRKDKRAMHIVLSRIGITEFLKECGLKQGNKILQEADIPTWIKEDDAYRIACMRGLFDTDGSVFTHRYTSKGKPYAYKKLSFTSVSLPLLHSAKAILNDSGLTPRLGSRYDIRIDSKADVQNYFVRFGSHNPKHLKRYAS